MAFAVYRVLPVGGEWIVKRDGSPRAPRRFTTKEEAIDRGREAAERNRPSQLLVELADGTIERGSAREEGIDPSPG